MVNRPMSSKGGWMGARINYTDDLFYIHSLTRTLKAGIRLDIDPELFRDKFLEDVFFLNSTLLRLYTDLKENTLLIKRADYLRALRRTLVAFSELLDELISGDTSIVGEFAAYAGKLKSTRATIANSVVEIDVSLDSIETDEEDASIVSSKEFGFLLSEQEEETEEE